ncbi:BatD family protein [Galbibacter sp. PAP.153]|uniref:BatD family protein n=1 Tax=Galbibacter sp. PAP.153 TaxID=3104623 RepID=UPI003009701C
MKRLGKVNYILFLSFLFLGTQWLQAQSVWSSVQVNKKSVYVGEPVQVSITVYTSTWFTKGLDLGNITVNGAFTVYFRPVSRSFMQNGKNYSGVELIYHVFPFSDDDIQFPSLDIEVETPPPGGYKGVKRVVKSKAVTINVKPIPANFKHSEWLVATSLNVSERWSGSTKNIKVGDVLERTITRNAGWTVAELIPPTEWDSLPHVSIYPGRSEIHSNKSKTAISAQRTETVRYLFEEEGDVTIPDKVYTWYNSYHKKLYKRTLKGMTVHVGPNPDLGMLESVRDSLMFQQQEIVANENKNETKTLTILGLSPKQFVIATLGALLLLLLLFRFFKWLLKYIKARRKAYLHSELYYFNRLKKAIRSKDELQIKNAMYRWIDELDLKEPSINYLIIACGSESSIDKTALATTLTQKNVKELRKNYLHREEHQKKIFWINP